MLIESIIRRKSGTSVTLGESTYKFRVDDAGRHVAEVDDQAHVATLLAIKDGFRLANASDAADIAAALPSMDGAFFIFRGPQDAEAFRHFLLTIPDMCDDSDVEEMVLLIDKIAIGEASLDGHPFVALTEFPALDLRGPAEDTPPKPIATPIVPSGDNTILPQDHSPKEGTDEGALTRDTSGSGDGGAGAADGAGTDSGEEESDEEEEPVLYDAGISAADLRPAVPLDREALAMEYDALFGHRPNGRWAAEKIAAAIAEKKAAG